MLVGGGSLTPHLPEELGKILNLQTNRVAVRGVDAIQNLTRAEHISPTPELVTPIGIAIAARKAPIHYMSITVNEQIVRLFELKEMTVGDAFLSANIRAKQLYGKLGHGLSVTVNGQRVFVPGEHGQPAQIVLNGITASTKSQIKNGDQVQLIPGTDGADAVCSVRDIIDEAAVKTIMIRGTTYIIEPNVSVNGEKVNLDTPLKDRDIIVVETVETIEDAFKQTNNDIQLHQFQSYFVHIDGKPVYLPEFSTQLFINGKPGKIHYPIQNGDVITFEKSKLPTAEQIAAHLNLLLEEKIVVTFQNEQVELVKSAREFFVNGHVIQGISTVPNGATIKIIEKDMSRWIYQDVFRFSTWQLPTAFKGSFTILRNGQPSTFDTEIFGGDRLEIQLTEQPIVQ